ncbi:LacI family DNA-binding transcriptional regulator [Glycomyces salinus]|uniref:LacI family DNA-binding transcriptional regulator n=1 Tax=Glycomyces salinus TaxID=980294 RepID=UPI0018ECF3E3|nr:LacI family DNA-binding transcriptional regulator [Glycomyces salinus]
MSDPGKPTMSDVARMAGVSKMTVSNVVNNRVPVSDAVRQRVLEAIRETGYRLNVTARVLKSGRTGVIGLAVPDIGHAYFGHLATLVIAEARRYGLHVALEQTGAAEAGELDAIAQSHRLQFDGLILSAVGADPGTLRLPAGNFPVVLLGEQGFSGRFDHVLMPNEDGAKAATLHLIDQGCERVAFLGAGELDRLSVASRRQRGYLAAFAERGIEPDPDLMVPLSGFDLTSGREAGRWIADSGLGIDGALTVTDSVAQGVLRGLADRGVSVPGQVRLLGFDDIPEAACMVPSLSTVAPDHRWMAAKAVDLVAARIGGAEHTPAEHMAPFELKIRESTA